MNDPRFDTVREALAAYAGDSDDPPLQAGGLIQAAVAVVLRRRPDDLDLLLIKRARHERDPWSGHMALPGGRRDAADASLLETAVRETLEETAVTLDPRGPGFLGRLERVTPSSPNLPPLTIAPFVFGVPPATEARPAPAEVDRVHWVSLSRLRGPGAVEMRDIALPGGARPFPGLPVAGEFVWGLTYRILTDLFERFPERLLSPPPTRR
jgi:8-oxo-dGTP pyrophosphatase MutT (NUDIX family)